MGFSKTLLVFSLLVCQGRLGEGRPPLSARIGGVFNSIDSSLGASLAHVVAEINNSSALLPDTRLDQLTAYSELGEPLESIDTVCRHLAHSVFAVLTATEQQEALMTAALDRVAVPHISLQVSTETEMSRSGRLHMAPSRESLGLAFLEAALQVGGRVGLVRHPATAILEVGNLVEGLDNPLLLQLTKADNRAGLVMLREGGVTTYLVDLAGPLVKSFMYQAMQAGLLAPGTTFIFSSLDFPSLELDFARLSGARLLGFSLMDQEAREDLNPQMRELVAKDYRAALVHDSVLLFSSALATLSMSIDPESERLECRGEAKAWSQGELMAKTLRDQGQMIGLTGSLGFSEGWRLGQELHLVSRGADGLSFLASFNCDPGEQKLVVWSGQGLGSPTVGLRLTIPLLPPVLGRALAERVAAVAGKLGVSITIHYGETPNFTTPQVGTGWVLQSKDLHSGPKKVGVLLPLLALPSPKSSYSSFPIPWSAYLGLILPLPLTALLLSILSHLSPYQSKESTLTWGDSLWTLASVLLLNLPETKIKAASLRTLLLGWSLFLLSSLLIFSISLHIHLLDGSEEGATFQVLLPPSSPLLPSLSRVLLTGEGLVEESLKVEDLLWMFYWSLLILPCLLFFSLLLALLELLTYCSHHQRRGGQSLWTTMVASIKVAMKRAREVDDDGENGEEGSPSSPPLSPSHLTEGEAVRRALLERGEEERRL